MPETTSVPPHHSYKPALKTLERARHWTNQLYAAIKDKERTGGWDSVAEHELNTLVPKGLYEGWKSSEAHAMFYIVYGLNPDVDGLVDPSVSYLALYRSPIRHEMNRLAFTPGSGALVPVEKPRYRGARLRLVRRLGKEKMRKLEDARSALLRIRSRTYFLKKVRKLGII